MTPQSSRGLICCVSSPDLAVEVYKESPLRMKANIKMTVTPEATVLREYRLLRSVLSEIYHEKAKCSHGDIDEKSRPQGDAHVTLPTQTHPDVEQHV